MTDFYLLSDVSLIKNDSPIYKSLAVPISVIKTFFNFKENQNIEEFEKSDDFQNYKKQFINYMDYCHSSTPTVFFDLLQYFYIKRPKLQFLVKSLIPVVLDYSLKNFNQKYAQSFISEYTIEEKIKDDEKQQHKKNASQIMEQIIFDDDYDSLIKFLNQHQSFNIDPETTYSNEKTPLELCCIYGSVHCFKFFYLNKCQIRENISSYSIRGGNSEIVQILIHEKVDFSNAFIDSIVYHRYSLTDFLLVNYKCDAVSLNTCFASYNFEAFLYFFYNSGCSFQNYLQHYKWDEESKVVEVPSVYINKCNLPSKIIHFTYPNGIGSPCVTGILPFLEQIISNNFLDLQELLDCAINNGFLHIVDYILLKLEKGKTLTYSSNELIELVCNQHYFPLINYLRDNKDKKGNTPLLIACQYGYLDIVTYLTTNKTWDKEMTNNDSETAFFIACKNGYLDIVEYLFNQKCNPEAKNGKGVTPLFTACEKGHLEIVKYLINKKCDIETKDQNGKTLLHIGTCFNHFEVVKYLISIIGVKEDLDVFGCTALHYAFARGCKEIAEYLISIGFHTDIKDTFKYTPLDYADNFTLNKNN